MPKYSSTALALALLTSADGFSLMPHHRAIIRSSFVPKMSVSVAPPSTKSSSSSAFQMLVQNSGGMFELEDLIESDTALTKTIGKSPKLWKAAGIAALPASALLGFGLVPSARIAVGAVGAVVSGVGGLVGKSKMEDMALTAAKTAMAQCVVDNGIENAAETAAKLREMQESFGCSDEDFGALCTEMYKKYLLGMVKFDSKPRSQELTELENLKKALMLDNLSVGEAHAMAAQEWFLEISRTATPQIMEDPESPEYTAVNKVLFLTERVLRQNQETQEAFLFEMNRVAKVFSLSYTIALERVGEVVQMFYARALKSARASLDSDKVSPTMLERARKTLGVDSAAASELHEEALSAEVRALLGFEKDPPIQEKEMQFAEGAMERLEKLRELLSLSESDVEYEILSTGFPVFRVTATEAMKGAVAGEVTPEEALATMEARKEELMLVEKREHELVCSGVAQALGDMLMETKRFADVNNEAKVHETTLEILEAKKVVLQVLEKAGWEGDFEKQFCNPIPTRFTSSINAQLELVDRTKMFDIFMKRVIPKEGEGYTEEQEALIKEVSGLLSITRKQVQTQVTKKFGPKLNAVLVRGMNEILEDCTPHLLETLQAEVQTVVDEFKLDDRIIEMTGRNLYTEALNTIHMNSPQGIPSVQQNEALAALRKLYRIRDEDVNDLHVTTFTPVYRQAVEEAMSITGIIRPEYKESLLKLRGRLGVSEQQARVVFLEAVQKRLLPMIQWIVEEMEKTILTKKQLAERRQQDLGEDFFQDGQQADGTLGLGAEVNILGDIMNLVDFYTENEITEKVEIDVKKVDMTVSDGDGDEEKTVTEEVPVYETTYPITAMGLGAVTQEMAEVLYRQFVVGGFTTQGPDALRYEKSRSTFGGILGLTSEKMEEIGSTIAQTVYDNYVTRAMMQKGVLDQQDMMFLANLQAKLGLSNEQGETMLMDVQKRLLSDEARMVTRSSNPEKTKAFREKCNSMGVELDDEIGISKFDRSVMFEVEVSPGLDSGEIGLDSGDVLTELQESLGFTPEEAEALLQKLIVKKANAIHEMLVKFTRRGRAAEMVQPLGKLVRLGKFLNGELGLEFEEADANYIFNVYDAMDFGDLDEATVEENKGLLRTILSLS